MNQYVALFGPLLVAFVVLQLVPRGAASIAVIVVTGLVLIVLRSRVEKAPKGRGRQGRR